MISGRAEEGIDIDLHIGDATRIAADMLIAHCIGRDERSLAILLISPLKELQDKSLADILAILDLTEIGSTGISVDIDRDFIDTRQRMQDTHTGFGRREFLAVEDEAILDTVELILIEETLLLNARHIEDVEFGHHLLKSGDLLIRYAIDIAYLLLHIIRETKLLGSDEHHLDTLITGEGLDEGMHRASELEVAAEADGQIIEAANLTLDCQQVGESLGGMRVGAIAGIDDGDTAVHSRDESRALLKMAHGDDIGKAIDYLSGVGTRLALADRRILRVGETEHIAPELHHRGREAEARAGGGFVEESGEFLALAGLGVVFGMIDDIKGEIDDFLGLLLGKIGRIYEMFHK